MAPSKKRKRPNFSDTEMLMLLTEVGKRKDVIFGPPGIIKDSAWLSVTSALNSKSHRDVIRHTKELRRKFSDFKYDVKKKAASITNQSTEPDFEGAKYTEVEEAMLLLISDADPSFIGSDVRISGLQDPLSCTTAATEDSIIVVSDNVEQIIPVTQYYGCDGSSTSQPVMVKPVPAPPVAAPPAGKHQDTNSRLSAPPATAQSGGGEVRQVTITPPCRPPNQPGAPPPGSGKAGQLTSASVVEGLQTQREIRDLLSELVQQQREAVMAQREAVLAQREAVMAQRETLVMAKEGIAALQAVVEGHRQSTSAMLALAQVVGATYKSGNR